MIDAIGLPHVIETFGLIGLIIAVALAVVFLKGVDRISGRGPKQVSDGIKQARASEVQPDMAPVATDAEKIDPIVVLKLPFARPRERNVCPTSEETIRRAAIEGQGQIRRPAGSDSREAFGPSE
jgi:hypothetical protein